MKILSSLTDAKDELAYKIINTKAFDYLFVTASEQMNNMLSTVGLLNQIAKHIVKLYHTPKDTSYDKHLVDIEEWLEQIDERLGRSRPKYPKYKKFIEDTILTDLALHRILRYVNKHYQYDGASVEIVYNELYLIFDSLCKKLVDSKPIDVRKELGLQSHP